MTFLQSLLPRARAHRGWLIAIVLLCTIEFVVAFWLRPDHSGWDDTALLQIDLPHDGEAVTADGSRYFYRDLPERLDELETQLSFTSGRAGYFSRRDLARAHAPAVEFFFFEFEAGSPNFINDVLGHAPEVCMEAGGSALVATHPEWEITVEDRPLTVRQLEFESPVATGRFHVFRVTWLPEGSIYKAYSDGREQRRQRIRGALTGNPRPPARTLLAGLKNFASRDEAARVFEELLVQRLTLSSPSSDK